VGTMVLLIFALVVASDAISDALRREWLARASLRRTSGTVLGPRVALEARRLLARVT